MYCITLCGASAVLSTSSMSALSLLVHLLYSSVHQPRKLKSMTIFISFCFSFCCPKLDHISSSVPELIQNRQQEDTYFFCSFLFFSAGPPKVPIPKPSLGELSASGVPAMNINKHLVQRSDRARNTAILVAWSSITFT